MRLRFNLLSTVALLMIAPGRTRSQEGQWAFSASAGVGFLSMRNVNETLESTIRFWNDVELIPVSGFRKISQAPSFVVQASYRYERDMAVSLSIFHSSTSVETKYEDPRTVLTMKRTVGSTDVMLGVSYFLPLHTALNLQLMVEAGLILARADAITFNSRVEKSGPSDVTNVYYDTDARYRKAKAIANVGSSVTWTVVSPVFIKTELLHRFANVGEMEGEIRRIQGTIEELSRTLFDFSATSVSVGIGFVID